MLSEADRIWPKHLITLEPGVSVYQTDELQARRLKLSVSIAVQPSCRPAQRGRLLMSARSCPTSGTVSTLSPDPVEHTGRERRPIVGKMSARNGALPSRPCPRRRRPPVPRRSGFHGCKDLQDLGCGGLLGPGSTRLMGGVVHRHAGGGYRLVQAPRHIALAANLIGFATKLDGASRPFSGMARVGAKSRIFGPGRSQDCSGQRCEPPHKSPHLQRGM